MNFHVTTQMAWHAQERGKELHLEARRMNDVFQVLKTALLLAKPF
jgi:hypothetical protein